MDDDEKLKDLFKRSIEFRKSSKKLPKWFLMLAALFLVLLFSANMFVVYIGPHEYGIKQVRFGPSRGVQPDRYSPGWAFIVPGMTNMLILPRNVQVFDLTGRPEERSSNINPNDKAAHIQTSDGFFVDADVSVLYHIDDPYKVITHWAE